MFSKIFAIIQNYQDYKGNDNRICFLIKTTMVVYLKVGIYTCGTYTTARSILLVIIEIFKSLQQRNAHSNLHGRRWGLVLKIHFYQLNSWCHIPANHNLNIYSISGNQNVKY
jgi:hypothetical protein